jgi:phage head maturation protease
MILKDLNAKKSTDYKVRSISGAVKDVDVQKRTVAGMFNSYFYIDSDFDMLLPGCASKSIQERGAGSNAGNKIKHLKDHNWNNNIARIDILDERKIELNGKTIEGIYHESYYPEASDSNDQLIKIQSGLYDDRSIGFRYISLALADKNSTDEDQKKRYDEYIQLALNPEKGEEHGFFWVVKEIMLFEGSDVSFGANSLTPLLGVKSNDRVTISNKLNEKLDIITSLFNKSNMTDEGFHRLEMEKRQIKSYINMISDMTPDAKGTFEKPPITPTNEGKSKLII